MQRIVGQRPGRAIPSLLFPPRNRRGRRAATDAALEIAWVEDPIDLFFLHIQGSGIVRLPDGREVSVGYAAQNGWPYRSIGRLLIDAAKFLKKRCRCSACAATLAENPREQDEIFAYNESYVFFRVHRRRARSAVSACRLPPGAPSPRMRGCFPSGALALDEMEIPVIDRAGGLAGWRPVARFVLNQDTGGAIRGPQRADLLLRHRRRAGRLGRLHEPCREDCTF